MALARTVVFLVAPMAVRLAAVAFLARLLATCSTAQCPAAQMGGCRAKLSTASGHGRLLRLERDEARTHPTAWPVQAAVAPRWQDSPLYRCGPWLAAVAPVAWAALASRAFCATTHARRSHRLSLSHAARRRGGRGARGRRAAVPRATD